MLVLTTFGPAQDAHQPVQVGLPGGDGARPAVRVEHDHDVVGQPGHQPLGARPDRLHDQAEAADVQSRGAIGQHRLGGADRGRRRAGQVEVVGGHAGRVQVDQGQRGRRVGRGPDRDGDVVALQVGPHQLAEAVAGQPAEEGRGQAEPGHRPGGVERGAAQAGIHVTLLIDDQVDQGLARDRDHALHSTASCGVSGRRRAGRAGAAGTSGAPGQPAPPPGASGRRNPGGRPRPPR